MFAITRRKFVEKAVGDISNLVIKVVLYPCNNLPTK